MKTFEELGVSEEIRRAITDLGFEKPMPVQEEVIPYLLGNRNDVIALAQTGTGKTAAFGIPILQRCDMRVRQTQALVLSPTRELCLQITDDIRDFSKYMDGVHVVPVYGGASIENQCKSLRLGAQIIVATPGRLIDLMNRGVAKLEGVRNVVLDEADEMLNMGFSESIDQILEGVPKDRNTLLFSATMSKEIEKIAKTYLHEYKEIVVGSRNEGAENVNHIYYMVNAKDKYLALKRIVDYYPKIYAIIFCRTKKETQEIADKLIHDGYNAESLHGDLSQQQRDLTMQKFRQHLTQLLVATDVAARGLDVEDLTHVINYGFPDDVEYYTHRSGRTGRAGKKGTSICILHSRERAKMRAIEKEIGKSFVEAEIPSAQEICKKQLYKVMDDIVKTDVNNEEIEPFMADINRYFQFFDKEDIIKKIVSMEFGKFLAYYADAPEIQKPSTKGEKKKSDRQSKERERGERSHKAERGYRRLFLNLGKADGFYPGEVMQFINKHIREKQEVGHIDLLNKISYIEVPEKDAKKVMNALDGTTYKGREVRCNDADQGAPSQRKDRDRNNVRSGSGNRKRERDRDRDRVNDHDRGRGSDRHESKSSRRGNDDGGNGRKRRNERQEFVESGKKDDWRQFFQNHDVKLKGEEPDFSEEGWARRKPKKK
ncbi:MAG: DEAD/DEAH box helicase [Prevotella sp.]|nr:DEAD/DEAH box helicase [Prevotella sp.]